MPKRGERGLANLDLFYDGFNDINFYVEDIDQENLYMVILNKIFVNYKISRIFPLGGKTAVIAHAHSENAGKVSGYRAYLIDRDFDFMLNKEVSHPNIFYLDWHCIENYLIEPDAILEVVIENRPKTKRQEAAERLDLESAAEEIYKNLRTIFVLHYCVQRLNVGIKNCGKKSEEFCKPEKQWEIKFEKVNSYIAEIVNAAKEVKVYPPLEDPLNDERMKTACGEENERLVSGKYVMAMIFHYIKSIYPMGPTTFDSFVYRTAKNCTLLPMKSLADKIKQRASS